MKAITKHFIKLAQALVFPDITHTLTHTHIHSCTHIRTHTHTHTHTNTRLLPGRGISSILVTKQSYFTNTYCTHSYSCLTPNEFIQLHGQLGLLALLEKHV